MESNESTSVNWRGLSAGEPSVMAAASSEVEMYVRALAAYGVTVDRDAVPSELEDRQSTIRAKLWPEKPLDGYGLHSSLGAFLVTKVAVDLVPTGHLGLRPEHLSPEALRHALVDHGLTMAEAHAVVGDWPGEPDDFRGDPSGLSLSELAGLAARTLTREERRLALAQVAASPRDLARLAASTSLLNAVRTVLPLLPIPSLGPTYDLAVVGLSIGRGDRVAVLLRQPTDVLQVTLQELAAATASLAAGQPFGAPVDAQVTMPGAGSSDIWRDKTDEDIVDIVEVGPQVTPCHWQDGTTSLEEVETWQSAMGRWRATTGTLGLRLAAPPPTMLAHPIPPDARWVRWSSGLAGDAPPVSDGLEAWPHPWRGDPIDALAPVVRGATRIVASAAEGTAPSAGALERAGDLAWLVRRATALAAVAKGDLQLAIEATEPLSARAAPELRWAQDRLRRFANRMAEPASPQETRPMAAVLLGDLAHQFARTITGTVPRERR